MRTNYLLFCLVFSLLLLLFIGCEQMAPKATDIPVTSTSEEAIALFEKGRDALEFGRTDDARALFDEAIGHYFSAGDFDHAADLVERIAHKMMYETGEVPSLQSWLAQLPKATRRLSLITLIDE